ncbi:hypothetical protein KM043_005517 [Ampulex compressa]|nr:hypothetical protein KM043_005517 [Ampulex compressa]
MEPIISLPLPADKLEEIIDKAKDWALMHGMCMRSKVKFNRDVLQYAPFVLLPSPFPRKEFNEACQIQPMLNLLMHKVAQDFNFLRETLEETIKVDNFTKRLFNICEIINAEGITQKVSLGLLRSDIMLETTCPRDGTQQRKTQHCCFKQVEINTIASGFGWLGPAATQLHKYVLQELECSDALPNLPENNALSMLCTGLLTCWNIYGDLKAVILFVVEDVTYNICDQRFHEYEIRKQNPKVKVIRKTLTQLAAIASLGSKKELVVDGNVVSVVYYRCGYEPAQYYTEKEWDVRLLIEKSLAIKCPNIQYHLAGTKKVQQALTKSGVIDKFLKDEKAIKKVKEMFTGLYALDLDEHGDVAVEMGIAYPDNFVLKPQREGGSNNMYGVDIKHFLSFIRDKKDRAAWILMDKIYPPLHKSYIIRPESNTNMEVQELVSELGIFGIIIANEDGIFINKQGGHMLRTKLATANEGGVASGLGACDSPYLID